jgi:hypothetical protein
MLSGTGNIDMISAGDCWPHGTLHYYPAHEENGKVEYEDFTSVKI